MAITKIGVVFGNADGIIRKVVVPGYIRVFDENDVFLGNYSYDCNEDKELSNHRNTAADETYGEVPVDVWDGSALSSISTTTSTVDSGGVTDPVSDVSTIDPIQDYVNTYLWVSS